jgi:hypothetical protein
LPRGNAKPPVTPPPYSPLLSIYFKYFKGDNACVHDKKVHVDGPVESRFTINLPKCPVPFGTIRSTFECDGNFKTTERLPDHVGSLALSGTSFKSLEGITFVNNDFDLNNNNIESLIGIQDRVDGSLKVHNNKLTSLIGAPKYIQDEFVVTFNPLTSLDGLPECMHSMWFTIDTSLPLLKLMKAVIKNGVFISRSVSGPSPKILQEILNRNIFSSLALKEKIWQCQNDLISNGLDGNARW